MSDPARYRRLRDLLHAAAERPPGERRAWLAARADGDDSIVGEVLALLEGDGPSTRHLAPPTELGEEPALEPGAPLGRFRVRSLIGRGGMGVVYEAADAQTGAVVAVKAILPRFLAVPSARERFLREARLGLSIAHENVVRTIALEEAGVGDARIDLLVMERVRGRTLRALVDEMGTVPEGLWREIGLQAARGLAAVHDAGVVHRDVKPENVLLTDDRRVRIMDLGIAKPAIATSLTIEGHFLGSVRYASPEQVGGTDVGPASDVYSLGVVLYELATGRVPFDADDPIALLRAHAEAVPVPAGERNPALSDFASEVVDTCLKKRPQDRFASGHELARVLSEAERGAWWEARRRRPRGPRPPARREPPARLPLVARDEEREALREAWRSARAGSGRTVLLVGEAGIGKTRLVEDLLGAVADERATVLRSELAIGDGAGGIGAALASALGSDLETEVAARLDLPPQAAAELAGFLERRDPSSAPRALSAATVEGLVARLARSLAAETPVLWVIEDAHAADDDARRLLAALARGVADSSVLLVVTARPGTDPRLLSALGLSRNTLRIDLGRLSEAAVGDLAGRALGDPALGERLAGTLARRADGVPLFVLEILRDLERRGRLVRGADGSVRETGGGADTGAPGALADLLRARVAGLEPAERAVLEAAAVVGYEFDPALVAAARGIPRLEALDVLGRLERRDGLVRSGAVLGRFDHHLLQEVLYGDLPSALRAELHDRVADAIKSQASDGDAGALAWRIVPHRLRGPRPERAVPHLVAALTYGDRTLRWSETYRTAMSALDVLHDDPAARADVVARAAGLSVALGRASETEPWLEESLRTAQASGDVHLLARLHFRRAEHGLSLGRFARALDDATAAQLAYRGLGLDREAVGALRLRGQALWCLGSLEESARVQEEALGESRELASPRLVAMASSDLGIALHEMGRLAEAEAHLRAALEASRRLGDRTTAGTALNNLGNVLYDAGRRAEALASYEETIAIDRQFGRPIGEAIGWVNVGKVRLSFGDLEGARDAFRRCEAVALESGAPRVEAYAIAGLGTVALWSGGLVEARRRFEAALERRRSIAHRPGIADTCLALGSLAAEEGRVDEARSLLREAARVGDDVGDPSVSSLARIHLAATGEGDVESARAAFAAVDARLRHDARLEGHLLLFRATNDLRHLREAKRAAEEQLRDAPPAARAAMVERVPVLRELAALKDPG